MNVLDMLTKLANGDANLAAEAVAQNLAPRQTIDYIKSFRKERKQELCCLFCGFTTPVERIKGADHKYTGLPVLREHVRTKHPKVYMG